MDFDFEKLGVGIVASLEKLKTERRLKADVKTLKEINIPAVLKLNKTRTNAQLKEDIKSVKATVNLTAKASKKGLSTSVKDIVKQAQEIANKNNIKLNIGGINDKKLDDIIAKLKQLSQSSNTLDTSESVNAINREAQAMLEIIDNARKAALEKLEFAEANREVRESAENTADAIVRERNAMESMNDIHYILANVNMNAQQGESVFRRFGNTLNEAFATYTVANLLEDAIYEIIDAGKEGIEVVKELNDVATSLRMATGGSLEETNALVNSYNDLGQELGAITSDVSESADAWLRQGHSIADTNTLIADSMMLSKIANLKSAESTEYLTSIMQAYKLSAEEVVDIVSKLSAVDLESASDAGGLAKSLSRCASAAEMAGVSMDTLIGYISTVKEVTQDSDEAVGNMFKSVFSRMNQIRANKFVDLETGESLNDTEKVLNKIGIVTRDLNNQLIDSEQILDAIGKSWNEYDSNTQKALATAVAGTYQYNKFIALMQSYGDAINYANISANSKGVAEEKFSYYLDSLESKTNALQASLENLAMTTFSDELYASVLDTSKAVVDLIADTGVLKGLLVGLGASGALYGFQQITHSLGDITQGFANLNEAMNMSRSGFITTDDDMQTLIDLTGGLSQSQTRLLLSTNNLTDEQKIAILMNQGLTQAEAQQMIQTWGVATAQNGATVATVTLTNSLRGLWMTLMANPLILVTTLVSAGVMAFDAYNRKIEETKQQFADLKSEVSQIESELSSLNTELQTTVDRMNELESKDTLTFTEKEEYDNLVKQNNELQRRIDLLELEQKTKNKELNKAFVDTMVSDTHDKFEYTKDDAGNVFKGNSALYNMSDGTFYASDEKEFIEYQFALHKEYSEKMAQLNKEIGSATDERKEEIAKEIETLETSIEEIETYLSSKNTDFSTTSSEISYISNPTTEDEKAVNAWLDYIADFQDRMAIAMGGTNAKENAFSRIVDNWQFDKTVQGLQDLGEQGQVTADMLDDPKYDTFINKLVELGFIETADDLETIALAFNNVADAMEQVGDSLGDSASFSDIFNTEDTNLGKVSEKIDTIQNAYKTLSSAIDEYNENGTLSIDTLQSVIELGDDWLDYLVDENGNLKLDNEALQNLTASRLNDMRVQTLNNLIDNVSKIQTDADANEYLASTNYALAESYEAVAQASLESARAKLEDAVAAGTLSQVNMDATMSKATADISKINKLFNNTSLGSISLGGGSSSSSSKSEFSELVDFFERRVKVLSNALELLDANLENVSGSFAKNKLIDGQLAINEEKIKNYSDALKMYTEGADYALSKLPSDIAEKVKNGAVDVTNFVGEENEVIAETIDEYEKWADKVADCQQELAQLHQELENLELQKFSNIIEDFNSQFDIHDKTKDLLEKQIDLFKESGLLVGESFFNISIEQSEKQLVLLEQEKAKLVEQLNFALASGRVKTGSEAFLSMIDSLNEVESSIIDVKTEIESLDTELKNLHWENVERVADKFSNMSSEISNLIKLIDDVNVSDKDGNWNEEGLTKLGLYMQEYEKSIYVSQMYAEEIDKLNQAYINGEYSALEYQDKLASLTEAQWDNINASEEALDAIVALNESRINIQIEGIEDEIDAFKELTNAQIEALEASKDLHDYQEDIADKTKDVTDLEKQIAALALDTSASGIAKRKKLEEELAEAKKALADAEYEHSIEMQKEALTKQYENFESEKNEEIEALENSLKDQESIISQSFETVKRNANTVGQEIANIAKKHGVTVSTTLTTSWQQGEFAIANYGATLSTQTSGFINNLVSVENEVYTLQEKADETSVSISSIFSTKADNLLSELIASYNSIENVNTVTNALQDSLVSTLESGYDVSGITSAIDKIVNAVDDLSSSIATLGKNLGNVETEYTATVNLKKVSGSLVEGVDPLSYKNATPTKFAIAQYASGTRSTEGEIIVKNEEGFELTFPKLSSGNYALAPEGSQILTKPQTDNLFDWSKYNPDTIIPRSIMDSIKTVPNIPQVVNRNVERPVNINNSITFTGAVNNADNFARDIAKIADRQVEKSWSKAWDYLQYHG